MAAPQQGGAEPLSLSQKMKQKTQNIMEEKYPDARVLTPSGPPKDISVSEMGSQALKNLPSSAYEAGAAIVHPFMHPQETAENLYGLGKGLYSKAKGAIGIAQDPTQKAKDEAMADAVGQFYKNRYGGLFHGDTSGLKQAVAKDPFGVLLDLSIPFTGGEAALARVPGAIGSVGKGLGTIAKWTDPMRAGPAALGAISKVPGIKPIVEAVQKKPAQFFESRAKLAPDTLSTAYEAGRKPSPDLEPFVEQMRGTAPRTDIVNYVNDALENQNKVDRAAFMKDRNAALSLQQPVNFNDIDSAWNKANQSIRNRAGGVMFDKAEEALKEIKDKVDFHKTNNLNTLQDMDDLKRTIDGLYSKYSYDKDARRVLTELKNSVKNTIGNKSQSYLDLLEKETERRNLIKQFEFAAGSPDAIPEKQLAKIMSSMKKEDRRAIIDQIAQLDPKIASAIRGASVSDMGRISFPDFLLYGLGSIGAGHPAGLSLAAANYLSESPRVLGETAYRTGKAAKVARDVIDNKYVRPVVEVGKASRPLAEESAKYEERKRLDKEKKKFQSGMVPQQANGGRIARASGGKIEVLRGVRALMRAAENAKKEVNKTTEPLLDQPDETIAQALSMAKQKI
jgi:hypothetical protein